MQTRLDEEESKNMKLQQHINKLEHHSAQIQEVRVQCNTGLYVSVRYGKVISTAVCEVCSVTCILILKNLHSVTAQGIAGR